MFAPVVLFRNGAHSTFGYGLGVRIGRFAGRLKIGHTGSGSGGTSVVAEYPEEELVIAVITNSAGDGILDARRVEAALALALLGTDRQTSAAGSVSPDLLVAAPGLYRSPVASFCITARGGDLWRSTDDDASIRLVHMGDGRFRSADDDARLGTEYFLGIAEDRAQWFAYDGLGFPEDLAVRTSDSCG